MMAREALVLVCVFAIAVCGDDGPARSIQSENANRYMARFTTRCFLSGSRTFAYSLLKTLPSSIAERAVLKRNAITIDACFGTNSDGSRYKPFYQYDRMRSGIVRALLLLNRSAITEQVPLGVTDSQWYPTDSVTTASDDTNSALANEIGFCIARQNWPSVRAIVLAVDPNMEKLEERPKSADNRESKIVYSEMQKIISTITNCVPNDVKMFINRSKLRDLLEESVLHIIKADQL